MLKDIAQKDLEKEYKVFKKCYVLNQLYKKTHKKTTLALRKLDPGTAINRLQSAPIQTSLKQALTTRINVSPLD